MSYARPSADTTHVWAIPAVLSTTFSTPQTFYVQTRGGDELQFDAITTKEQIDLGVVNGVYRDNFRMADLTAGGNGFLAIDASTPSTKSVPDDIMHVAPRFTNQVVTCWRYTNSTGGTFDVPFSRWLSDSPNPKRKTV